MPDIRRIKATYYPVRQAHPRRTDWQRVVLTLAAAIVAAILIYVGLVYVLTAF